MINTQRMSSMAFSIRDGLEPDPGKLTSGQRKQAIRYSFFCFFQLFVGPWSILWGPLITFILDWTLPMTLAMGFKARVVLLHALSLCLLVVNLRVMSGATPAFSTIGVYTVQVYIQHACLPDIPHAGSGGQTDEFLIWGSSEIRYCAACLTRECQGHEAMSADLGKQFLMVNEIWKCCRPNTDQPLLLILVKL